jgi:hypothetical protein
MRKYQALKDALKAVTAIAEWTSEELGVWMSGDPVDTFVCAAEDAQEADYIAAANPATISALLADLEAAEKDAERYRWLKEKGAYEPPRFNDADGYSEFQVFFWTHSNTLDAAIDAALSQLKGD